MFDQSRRDGGGVDDHDPIRDIHQIWKVCTRREIVVDPFGAWDHAILPRNGIDKKYNIITLAAIRISNVLCSVVTRSILEY